jgi:uncharacterized membrane protein
MQTLSLKGQLRSPWFLSMVLASFLALGILALRIFYTHHLTYAFLAWNLFLAWVPFGFSTWAAAHRGKNRWGTGLLLAAWLLFFPNAPYVLTDLFHLYPRPDVPLWYDLILILSFAWNALLLGYASLYQVQAILREYLGEKWSWILVGGLLFLTSFGVYLGRYLRWNSWDALTRPMSLFADIFDRIIFPWTHLKSTGFTLCFGLFLAVTYATFAAWIQHDHRH